jgi:hypothetical protein
VSGIEDKALLGVRKWKYDPSWAHLESLIHYAAWYPRVDKVADGCKDQRWEECRVSRKETIDLETYYLALAKAREKEGYLKSARRFRAKARGAASRAEREGKRPTVQFATRVETTGHFKAGHDAPGEECTCGLYAYYVSEMRPGGGTLATFHPFNLTGLVAAWGPTIFHNRGFRSKYMRIVAFFRNNGVEPENLKDIAALFGVPVIGPEDVELFALAENYQTYKSRKDESG